MQLVAPLLYENPASSPACLYISFTVSFLCQNVKGVEWGGGGGGGGGELPLCSPHTTKGQTEVYHGKAFEH